MQPLTYKVDPAGSRKRLDLFLSNVQREISRSQVKRLIELKKVSVNGELAPAKYKVKPGDVIEIDVPPPVPLDLHAEAIPLNIVFEDDCMVVVDKPPGMVVHPAPGHFTGTLVNALLHHCPDLTGIGGVERPGIVHRLDKDTSGLVLVAKNETAHRSLTRQFKQRTIRKIYLALVRGIVKADSGVIDLPIGRHKIHRKKMAPQKQGGREATTAYEVIARYPHFSYLRLFPKTGRTHQIRVHVASLGHPILGDKTYGGKLDEKHMKMPRQALHAHRLEIVHPVSGEEKTFVSSPPTDLDLYLKRHESLGEKL
ncbi:MAG: pseudouridine synthase [Nitrospinaceae bacterium]|nr:MAG: pseudouridine synthase [Nitrospinaceae bacterium]